MISISNIIVFIKFIKTSKREYIIKEIDISNTNTYDEVIFKILEKIPIYIIIIFVTTISTLFC